MSNGSTRQPGRPTNEGAEAAAREHERLKIGRDAPVDIFDVIERSGIWLMFQPLDNLYGAYERAGEAAGIIINAKQPPSLQRFTAAHEYGHHVLGHDPSLDDESHILPDGARLSPHEQAAHTFAAHFLMPPAAVAAILERIRQPGEARAITPRQAYLLSLELGVSYAAAVHHLASLGMITSTEAAQLRRYQPKQIKAEITRQARPRNDRVDTWPLREQDAGRLLHPRVNDELHANLPEMPSSGFLWTVASAGVADIRPANPRRDSLAEASLALVADDFVPPASTSEEPRYGTGGTRRLVFRVLRPGRHRLGLARRRPWQSGASPAATWEIDLEVAAPRTGATSRGLSERQKLLLAAGA